jgi:hypothetical protein
VCIYQPAVTQQSGDSVLALIFGYARLMRETKKALYMRVLRRYPAASKQSICVVLWKRSVSVCALGSIQWPD